MCTPLPIRSPRVARAPSRELGTLSAPGIHEGSIVLSVRVRLTDARHEGEVIDQDSTVTFCDGPPYGSMHSGQGDAVGEFVRLLVEGEGGGSALGCVVPRDPLD